MILRTYLLIFLLLASLPSGPISAEAPPAEDADLGQALSRAQSLFAERAYAEAAEAYLALADAHPDAEWAPMALFNAAVSCESIARLDLARPLYERVADAPDASPQTPDARLRLAYIDERLMDFESAATRLVEFHDSAPVEHPQRAEALMNAAQLWRALEAPVKAAALFERHADEHPDRDDVFEALIEAARLHQASGDAAAARRLFARAGSVEGVASDPRRLARLLSTYLEEGDAARERGDVAGARAAYEEAVARFERSGGEDFRAQRIAANAAISLAELDIAAWDAIALDGRPSQLEAKQDGLRALSMQLREIIGYRDMYTGIASQCLQGDILQRFARALAQVDCTQQPDAQACAERIRSLRAGALESALLSYEWVVGKSAEMLIQDECVMAARHQLQLLSPRQHPLPTDASGSCCLEIPSPMGLIAPEEEAP